MAWFARTVPVLIFGFDFCWEIGAAERFFIVTRNLKLFRSKWSQTESVRMWLCIRMCSRSSCVVVYLVVPSVAHSDGHTVVHSVVHSGVDSVVPSVVHSAVDSVMQSVVHSDVQSVVHSKSTLLILDHGHMLKRSGRLSRAWTCSLPASCGRPTWPLRLLVIGVAADLAVAYFPPLVWRPIWQFFSATGCQTVPAIGANMAPPVPITPRIARRHGAGSNIADGLHASGGEGGVRSRAASGRRALQGH